MSVKTILVLCAQALLLKSALGQSCTSRAAVADTPKLIAPCEWAAPTLAAPCGWSTPAWGYDRMFTPAMEFVPTSGGALPISSVSAMAPVGISIVSDNTYEGILAVDGELPFVSTVAMEGAVPSAGAGAVSYSCGNGRTAMISETAAFAPAAAKAPLAAYGPGAAFAPVAFAAAGCGLRGGWASRGCGCAM